MEIDLCDVDRAISRDNLETIIIQYYTRKRMIMQTRETFEPEIKRDNWILKLLYIVLGALAFWVIVRLVKSTYKRRKIYR